MSKAWPSFVPDEVLGDSYLLENVDYGAFKLFHLSILWRASIARRSEWSAVSLGPRHEQRLRASLLEGKAPGRSSYPLLATLFVGPETRRAWHVVVANHSVVDPANPFVLSEHGQLGMPAYDIMQLREVDIAKQIRFRWVEH
jgi:hypothetical protein